MKMPYEKWECFRAGMYRTSCDEWEELKIRCAELLSSDGILDTMVHVTEIWPIATAYYFNKSSSAWVPWLGHSSCCFEIGAPNWVTKKAWHNLSSDQQYRANLAAYDAYSEYMDRMGVKTNGQGVLI